MYFSLDNSYLNDDDAEKIFYYIRIQIIYIALLTFSKHEPEKASHILDLCKLYDNEFILNWYKNATKEDVTKMLNELNLKKIPFFSDNIRKTPLTYLEDKILFNYLEKMKKNIYETPEEISTNINQLILNLNNFKKKITTLDKFDEEKNLILTENVKKIRMIIRDKIKNGELLDKDGFLSMIWKNYPDNFVLFNFYELIDKNEIFNEKLIPILIPLFENYKHFTPLTEKIIENEEYPEDFEPIQDSEILTEHIEKFSPNYRYSPEKVSTSLMSGGYKKKIYELILQQRQIYFKNEFHKISLI